MARSSAVTVVISRDGRGAAGVRAGFEDALADSLRSRASAVLIVPHLYYLCPPHAASAALKKIRGDLVVDSWLHPRAAFWTLRALGVAGAPDAPGGASAERVIRCLNLADFASPADCAKSLATGSARGRAAPVREISDAANPRWYPVIDYSRCRHCRKCVDFCMFGVYSAAGGKVAVTEPDHCKNGCPACARICPQRAIMFPHYSADPAIAGAETSPPSALTEGAAPARSVGAAPPDDLEHLITSLEKLDA